MKSVIKLEYKGCIFQILSYQYVGHNGSDLTSEALKEEFNGATHNSKVHL